MNDLDLTDMLEAICADYWDARIFIDGRNPWAEQTLETKNQLKETVLPWIYRAAPQLLKKVEEDMRRIIVQAREAEMSDTEIVDHLLEV